MTTTEQGVITILRSAITGTSYPLPEDFNLEQAYTLLKAHSVLALGYIGAIQCGVRPDLPLMQQMLQDYGKSIWLGERQMLLVKQLFRAFDEAKIDYMPVKGCNLKMLYPEPGLRSMGDADILIRLEQYNRIVPIMEQLGYTKGEESDHELIWKQKFLMVELHKRLIPSYNKDYFRYYGDGWKLAKRAEGTHWYMTDEDQFIYVFTHFAKHYRSGGIGCRHVLDLWLCLSHYPDMDQTYIRRELQKLQLEEFYTNISALIAVWFEDAELDSRTDFMSAYILSSGNWGNRESQLAATMVRQMAGTKTAAAGRLRWLIQTAFPERSVLQMKYPVLRKWPVLLPVVWLHRLGSTLLKRQGTVIRKLEDLRSVTEEDALSYEKALRYVGLRFNFEEPQDKTE